MNALFDATLMENFHFLRIEWLWALVPAALLMLAIKQGKLTHQQDNWSRYIDSHLLTHLSIKPQDSKAPRRLPMLVFLATCALVIALAGPSWQKAEVPSYTGGKPIVAVLSLAQSMNANDLAPTRLKRATHKLRDLLQRTQGDERGLIIYADTPFVAAPLTSDAQVIEEMLPELSTNLMPVLGNRLDLAIAAATGLLQRAGANEGQIILLTDSMGDEPQASLQAAEAAKKAGFSVSVLGAGTEAGATLQTAQGQAITNQAGDTFQTQLPTKDLNALAKAGSGVMTTITAGENDIDRLLPKYDGQIRAAGKAQDFKADAWVDMGYWLLLLPIALVPFLFRRGVLFALVLASTGLMSVQPNVALAADAVQDTTASSSANASLDAPQINPAITDSQGQPTSTDAVSPTWSKLWKTPDQQGKDAFSKQDFAAATQTFTNEPWKAAANYRNGNYAEAANQYANLNDPEQGYNLGNALAKDGQFEGALESYDNFLEHHPEDENARFNRDLVAKLLQKQQEQQEQQQEQQEQEQSGQGEQQEQDQAGEGEHQEQDQSGQGEQQEQEQSGQGEQQELEQSDQGEQQEQEQSGDGEQQEQDQSGQGEQQEQEQSGQGEQQEQDQSGQGEQQEQDQSGQGEQQEQEQSGQGERQEQGQSGEGEQQEQDQSGQGEQQEQDQTGEGEQQERDQAGQSEQRQQAESAEQPSQSDEQQGASDQQNEAQEDNAQDESLLSSLLSDMLEGNADDEPEVEASIPGINPPKIDQAVEQQLRKVPDDPSGLLRARIRQHYSSLRRAQ